MLKKINIILSLMIFTFISFPILADEVGTIDGQFNVNNFGDPNYHIQLIVPDSINHFTPALALDYNPNIANNEFTKGWALSAKSTISTCIAPERTQHYWHHHEYVPDLCLDGKRLVLVNGKHGSRGAEYRQINNDNIKAEIVDYGTDNEHPLPTKMKVYDGHGGYGVYQANTNNDNAYVLARTEQYDKNNNVINYQWDFSGDCFLCLKTIQYGFKKGEFGGQQFQVKFNYKSSSPQLISGHGGTFKLDDVIDNIEFSFNGSSLYQYRLTVDNAQVNGDYIAKHLSEITRCSDMYHCISPTRFTYQSTGLPALSLPQTLNGTDYKNLHDFTFGDVDGDGDKDFVGINQNNKVVVSVNQSGNYSASQALPLSAAISSAFHNKNILKDIKSIKIDLLNETDIDPLGKRISWSDIAVTTNTGVFISQFNRQNKTFSPFKLVYDRSIKCSDRVGTSHTVDCKDMQYLTGDIHYADINNDGFMDLVEVPTYGYSNKDDANSRHSFATNKLGLSDTQIKDVDNYGSVTFNDISVFYSIAKATQEHYKLGDYYSHGLSKSALASSISLYKENSIHFLPNIKFNPYITNPSDKPTFVSSALESQPQRCFRAQKGVTNKDEFSPLNTIAISSSTGASLKRPKLFDTQGTCEREVFVADLNGNGRLDKAVIDKNGTFFYFEQGLKTSSNDKETAIEFLSGGNKFSNDINNYQRNIINRKDDLSNGLVSRVTYPRQFQDVNGDGLADFVEYKDDGVYVALNDGASLLPSRLWTTSFGRRSGYDRVRKEAITGLGYNNWGEASRFVSQIWFEVPPRKLIDVNGDGVVDIVGANANGVKILLSKAQKGTLNTITDGLGRHVDIEYGKPSHQRSAVSLVSSLGVVSANKLVVTKVTSSAKGFKKNLDYSYYNFVKNPQLHLLSGFQTVKVTENTLLGQRVTNSIFYPDPLLSGHPYSTKMTLSGKLIYQKVHSFELISSAVTHSGATTGYEYPHQLAYNVLDKGYTETKSGITNSQSNISFDSYRNPLKVKECKEKQGCRDITFSYANSNPIKPQWELDRPVSRTIMYVDDLIGTHKDKQDYTYDNTVNPTTIKRYIDCVLTQTIALTYDRYGIVSASNTADNTTKPISHRQEKFTHVLQQCPSSSNHSGILFQHQILESGSHWINASTDCFDNTVQNTVYHIDQGQNITETQYSPAAFNLIQEKSYNKAAPSVNKVTHYQFTFSHIGEPGTYLVHKTSAWAPEEKNYFDAKQRWVEKSQKLVDGTSWSAVSRTFNSNDLVTSLSLPYLKGYSPQFTHYKYDDAGRILSINRPSDNNLSFHYNSLSKPDVVISDNQNNTKTISYDGFGRIISIENALNDNVSYQYAPWAGISNITDAVNQQWHVTYNGARQQIKLVDPYIGVLTFDHDSFNNLTSEHYGNGDIVNYAFDNLGRLTSKSSSKDHKQYRYYFDSLGREFKSETSLSGRVTYRKQRTYFPSGLQKSKSVYDTSSGHAVTNLVTYNYTSSGQLKNQTVDGLGIENHYLNGYLDSVKGLNNGQSFISSTLEAKNFYTAYKKLKQVYVNLKSMQASCDAQKKIVADHERGNALPYNPLHNGVDPRIASGVHFTGGINPAIASGFHATGAINPAIASHAHTLGAMSASVAAAHSFGAIARQSFGASPPPTTTSIVRGLLGGNLIDNHHTDILKSCTNGLSAFPIDALNNAEKLLPSLHFATTHPIGSISGTTSYNTFDVLALTLFTAHHSMQPEMLFTIKKQDALISASHVDFGNGTQQSIVRMSNTGQIANIKTVRAGDNLQNINFDYNDLNLLNTKTNLITGRTETYQYDDLQRISRINVSDNQVRLPFQAANKSSYEQNFTYDEVGNLLEKDHNKYRYSSRLQHRDTASRVDYHTRMLMSVGPNALSYDNRGQVLGYGDKHYYWDGFGQSTKVQQGAKYVDFRYAPNGSRSSRFDYRSAHEQVRTYYVDNNIEKTTIINNGSKTEVKFTVYLGSRPVATLSKLGTNAIDVRYHYQDNLNSTTVTADNNGDVTSREIYQAFGKRHHIRNGDSQPTISLIGTQGGRADNKGYTGHEDVQDLSIIHMNGRIYDPDLGRFLSPDPYIGHIYADQNLNRYSYVLNNPMAYTDPSGHDPFAILGLFVTGYEMIDAYQNGGIEAALTVGAENIALNVLTGGLGSVVTLGGKLVVSKAAVIASKAVVAAAKDTNEIKALENIAADVTKSGPPRNADGTFAKVDGPTAGKPVDPATRKRILDRDQNADGSWTCATCGQNTTNPANIHTGHIKARSNGGDLSGGNLRCEGAACNLSQGAGSAPKPGRTCAARGSCGAPYGRTD